MLLMIYVIINTRDDDMNSINYCAKCGAKVTDNYKFCGSCGTEIERNTTEKNDIETKEAFKRSKFILENEEIKHVDNFMDDREFRNLVYAVLKRTGFTNVEIVDERLVDEIKSNDNDILAIMNGFTYLISTYLNKEITKELLDECFKDIEQNNATFGMIFTNTIVNDEIRFKAKNMNIEIVDRDKLIHII